MWNYLAFSLLVLFSLSGVRYCDDNSTVASSTPPISTTTENGTVTNSLPPVTTELSTSEANTSEANTSEPSTSEPSTLEPNTTSFETTTTTTAPTNPETTAVPTVTTLVPTTPMPKADVGKWHFTDKDTNITCIKAEMAVQMKIKKDGEDLLHNLSPNATTNGSSCNGTGGTQVLMLVDVDPEYKLTLTFVHKDKKVYVQNISVSFPTEKSTDIAATSGVFFSSGQDKSYKCLSQPELSFDNVTLTMSNVHVQAFKTTNEFLYAEECDQDDSISDTVPIAVGCALGALVIVVLIAYLVGRRRSRQKGYQSV